MWLLDFCLSPRLRLSAAISTCLCLLAPLHAEQFYLNDVMSKEMQKKTGVDHLSYKQRLALENWLNENFVQRSQPLEKKKTEAITLSQNIDNGKILELSDGSMWQVAPEDIERAAFWIVPFPLYFVENNDPSDMSEYPMKIVNQNTNLGVKVKQIRPPVQKEKPPEQLG